MKEQGETDDTRFSKGRTLRIVVQDSILADSPRPAIGRRLESPVSLPSAKSVSPRATNNSARSRLWPVRKSIIVAGVGAAAVLCLTAVILVERRITRSELPLSTSPQPRPETSAIVPPAALSPPTERAHPIEIEAMEVMRRLSRDNRPYSFSERAIQDIETQVREISQSPRLAASLASLQENSAAIAARAGKEGLPPSLIILAALALTKGGESADATATAFRVLPSFLLLSKMFGSSDADSSLILIAAFREGSGTKRSHPLLKRMSRAVNNPLTERNVWYLHEQNVLANDSYELVIDTISYGVIARNPRQFGVAIDPLNF